MTIDLMDMFQRHGYEDAFLFGHALEGNLHLVFSQVGCSLHWLQGGWGAARRAAAGCLMCLAHQASFHGARPAAGAAHPLVLCCLLTNSRRASAPPRRSSASMTCLTSCATLWPPSTRAA